MQPLTANDKRALGLIKDAGGNLVTKPSNVGFSLYPEANNDRMSSQGMALAGSRAMQRLLLKGLITIQCSSRFATSYKLTEAGKTECNNI